LSSSIKWEWTPNFRTIQKNTMLLQISCDRFDEEDGKA
jgi:hypothetical protein